MRWLFPVHRPCAGVSLTAHGVAAARLRRGWGRPKLARVFEQPLAEGMLIPSASDPNLRDRETCVAALRAAAQATGARTVALSLPDRAWQLAVFPFETVPAKDRDREAILRWRFQHDERVTLGEARILSRVCPCPSPPGASPASEIPITAYIVALAIKEAVVAQYEDACRAAGLFPVSIGCAALWGYTWSRPVLRQMPACFFVHLASDVMTLLAIKQGVPVYCRTKSRRASVTAWEDIASTLQFYEDLHLSEAAESREPIPLYLTGAGVRQGTSGGETDAAGLVGDLAASFGVAPVVLDWTARVATGGAAIATEEALGALACAGGS